MAVCFYYPTVCFYLTHLFYILFSLLPAFGSMKWFKIFFLIFEINTLLNPSSSVWIFRKVQMQMLHLKYLYWKIYHLVCYFCRVTIEGKPEPKDFSKGCGWSCRVCDNGISAIYSWFVGVNESVWGCLSGAIRLVLIFIPPWNEY